MKRIVYLLILLFMCSSVAIAQKSRKSRKKSKIPKTEQVIVETPKGNENVAVSEGNKSETSQVEESPQATFKDEVTIYRPIVSNDGIIAVSDVIDIPGRNKDEIFIGLLIYLYDNFDAELEEISVVDFDNRRVEMRRKFEQGEYKNATSYEYVLSFQMGDEMLSFVTAELKAEYREKGILPRKMNFEKLKPEENTRHKELFDEFSNLHSTYLHQLARSIAFTEHQIVTHWDELKAGAIVKGMNQSEVKIAKGKPSIERVSGARVKWMYGNEYVVIFTNGIVTSIIN